MSLGSDNSHDPQGGAGVPRRGDIIGDKYEIEQVIGTGGMGVVVAARHRHLNQRVAIKFLHARPALSDPVGRFMREARASAALKNEHVVRVMDVDRLPSGEPYMVMEFLAGCTLSRVIRERAPLPVHEAVDYLLQACEGVAEAHSLGIIHRDLKPGNLFLTQRSDGSTLVKVLDFGISKLTGELGESEQTLTATNMILGSPQYASPEQLRNLKSADTRTDIWALGIILYYMLAGRRPFEGESVSALCLAIGTENPVPLSVVRPDIPVELDEIVLRCLEKDRQKRIQNIERLTSALRPFATAGASVPRAPSIPSASLPNAVPFDAAIVPVVGPSQFAPSRLLSVDSPTGARKVVVEVARPEQAKTMRTVQLAGGVMLAALMALAAVKWIRTPAEEVHASIEANGPVRQTAVAAAPVPVPVRPAAPEPANAGAGNVEPSPEAQPDLPSVPSWAQRRDPDQADDGRGTVAAGSLDCDFRRSQWLRAKRTVSLTDRIGGKTSVGVVPKGKAVLTSVVDGPWAQVVYAGHSGKTVIGWVRQSDLDCVD